MSKILTPEEWLKSESERVGYDVKTTLYLDNIMYYYADYCHTEKTRWIPVEEGLPEKKMTKVISIEVLCCDYNTSPFKGFYDYESGEWLNLEFERVDVSFWQYLPEPPTK